MTKTLFSLLLIVGTLFGTKSHAQQNQAAIDDQLLTAYFAKNNIKAQKTPTGLYYVITKPGTGNNAHAGQSVSMHYRGTLLDGKVFDGNMNEKYERVTGRDAFTFQLGAGQVIRGWDEGIALLNLGTRATMYLPSGLAYGPRSVGNIIPANSVLIFDVEVLDIK